MNLLGGCKYKIYKLSYSKFCIYTHPVKNMTGSLYAITYMYIEKVTTQKRFTSRTWSERIAQPPVYLKDFDINTIRSKSYVINMLKQITAELYDLIPVI